MLISIDTTKEHHYTRSREFMYFLHTYFPSLQSVLSRKLCLTFRSRHNTFQGKKKSGSLFRLFLFCYHSIMADFDEQYQEVTPKQLLRRQFHDLQMANRQPNYAANQMHIQNQNLMGQQNQHFQNQNFPPQVPPHLAPRPNLNVPQPKEFTDNASGLKTFKHKLTQFLRGNHNTYFDDQSQVMYAASLLQGATEQWLETLDPISDNLPLYYTLELFLAELTAFFGGGVTMASWEHPLDDPRQTGTVSELAIAFQNIINVYNPRWTDSAAIYVLSRKLKDVIRFELGKKGDVP